jgi:hypothetical protein
MATTLHALTTSTAVIRALLAAAPEPDTAAARVVEHLIHQDAAAAFPEAQRARREAEDALALLRGFLEAGPNLRALTGLARDAAAFVARVEARS